MGPTTSGWVNYLDLKYALKAMADAARLNILHQLAGGRETNVTELVEALELSQPLVSWHLRSLRKAGLVRTRRRGREVYCSLDRARFAECQQALSVLIAAPDHAPDEARLMSPMSGPLGAPALAADERGRSPAGRAPGRTHPRTGPPDS